jgi:hypothetical protein
MVFWNEIDLSTIDITPGTKDKSKYTYKGGPLRFQIPRGACTWGVSEYKSFQIELSNDEFVNWWKNLESMICTNSPFTSNMKTGSLRVKIDESTYIFDENSKQVSPEIKEGLFRGQELSCIVDIDSNYFYNENWGLTVRAYQVRYYGTGTTSGAIEKGVCAFI